jgi:hypothetical protein
VWIVRKRLQAQLLEERRTIETLIGHYRIPLEGLIDVVAQVAIDWYQARPLSSDEEWAQAEGRTSDSPTQESNWRRLWSSPVATKQRLRAAVRAIRTAGDILRDLHEPLARQFDEAIASHVAHGYSPERAWVEVAIGIIRAGRLALDPRMSQDAVHERIENLPDEVFTLGEDAELFDPDAPPVKGLALAQYAIVMVRFAENLVRGEDLGSPGGPTPLDLERRAARTITSHLREASGQTKRPFYPHAATLLVASCPSRSLLAWRAAALAAAQPRGRLRARTPKDLPDASYRIYTRYLGRRLSNLMS